MRFLEVVSRGVETWLDMLPEAALPAALAGLLGAFLRVLVDALLDSMCRAGLHSSSLIVLVYPLLSFTARYLGMLIAMTLVLPIAMSYLSLRVERASGPCRIAKLAPVGFLGYGLLLAVLSVLGLALIVAAVLASIVCLAVGVAAVGGLIIVGLGLLVVLVVLALVWDMLVVLALVHSLGEGMGPLDSLIEAVGDAMEDPLTLLACGVAVHVIALIIGAVIALLTAPLPHTPLTLQVPARISLGEAAKVLEGLGLQVQGVSMARLAASTLTSMLIWPLIASMTLSYYLHLRRGL